MKKRLLAILILFAALSSAAFLGTHIYKKAFSPKSVSKEIYIPKGNYTTFTVSAVGDCTLASDANFSGNGSFEAEMKKVNYKYDHFFKNVRLYFESDDLTIINFEGTLSERGTRAEKEYSFRADPKYVKVLTTSSVEAANLANNHSGDYGAEALRDTKKILADNGITPFEGANTAIRQIGTIKVALIGTRAMNYFDEKGFLKALNKLKEKKPNIIIASFHWGEESSDKPNSTQKRAAHLAIDNGVDLVLGHHPHILQGIEKYKGKYIAYSLGNFCFGGNKNPSDKDTAIFRQTFVFKNGKLTLGGKVTIIPCSVSSEKSRNNYCPTPLTGEDFYRVKDKIIKLSAEFDGIENVEFINNSNFLLN